MIPYDKGRALEVKIARLIRRKLGEPAWRDSRSGAGWVKGDIRVPTLDFAIEAKNQNTIKIREWWNQVLAETPAYKRPALVLAMDQYNEVAVLKLNDFLDLLKTIADDAQTVAALRAKMGPNR